MTWTRPMLRLFCKIPPSGSSRTFGWSSIRLLISLCREVTVLASQSQECRRRARALVTQAVPSFRSTTKPSGLTLGFQLGSGLRGSVSRPRAHPTAVAIVATRKLGFSEDVSDSTCRFEFLYKQLSFRPQYPSL